MEYSYFLVAIELVTKTRRSTVSVIRKPLQISRSRARYTLKLLEHFGVVGPKRNGLRSRKILMTHEEAVRKFSRMDLPDMIYLPNL